MRKVFQVVGIATIVLGALAFLLMLNEPLIAAAVGFSLILSGCLLCAVADLMERVDRLEEQLGMPASGVETDPELPQKTCPVCGKSYDFDFPQCPYCGKHAESVEKA